MKLPPGAAKLQTGFRPQLLNPRPMRAYLNDKGFLENYDSKSLVSAAYQLELVKRFNTRLMARHLAEIRIANGLQASRQALQRFLNEHDADWGEVKRLTADIRYFAEIIPDT